jgi:hypothetical protein
VTDCAACGRANDPAAQFCGGCGRPLTAGVPPPPPPPPPPQIPAPAPAPASAPSSDGRLLRFLLHPNPRALLALLLLVASILEIVAISTAWWSYSSSGGGTSHSLSFLPGGNYNVTCSGSGCDGFSAGSFPYSNFGAPMGTLYGVVLGLMGVCVALTLLATAIAVLALLGRRTGWWQRSGSFVLVFVSALMALIAVVAAVTAQPGAFATSSMFDGLGSGGESPLTSFWGSNPSGTATWGAGAGWYVALATIILLGVITALLVVLGHERLAVPGRRSRMATTAAPAPARVYNAPPTAYTAPPTASVSTRPGVTRPPIPTSPATPAPPSPVAAPTEAPAQLACPTCGTFNLAKSRTCSYCQRSLRS